MKKFSVVLCILICSCGGNNFVPKPRAFPKLEFPAKAYESFNQSTIPYSFQKPLYTSVAMDTLSNYKVKNNWFNVYFKPFNSTLHLTYHKINSIDDLDSLVYDTRKFVNKQIDRAQDIREIPINSLNKELDGTYFDIIGYTATNLNFYITDNDRNFVRGALYFNYNTKSDSVAPIYRFMKEDVDSLIRSFKWRK